MQHDLWELPGRMLTAFVNDVETLANHGDLTHGMPYYVEDDDTLEHLTDVLTSPLWWEWIEKEMRHDAR